LVAISAALVVALNLRTPFKADILRDRGSLARELAGGVIENNNRIQLINAAWHPVAFTLQASELAGIEVTPAEIHVDAATTRLVAIAIQALGHTVPVDPARS
jgi:polyferredoxin